MLRHPGELLLRSAQIGPQILIGLSRDLTLAGRIEPVQRRVTESRRQRIARDDNPDDG